MNPHRELDERKADKEARDEAFHASKEEWIKNPDFNDLASFADPQVEVAQIFEYLWKGNIREAEIALSDLAENWAQWMAERENGS